MTMWHLFGSEIYKCIHNFCKIEHNQQFRERGNLHFCIINSHRVMNQFVQTLSLLRYNMNRVFFIYVDTTWENNVFEKFLPMNSSYVVEVTFHLVWRNAFKVHNSANKLCLLIFESAIKNLTKFVSSQFLACRIPRSYKLIRNYEVTRFASKFIFYSMSECF